MEKRNYVITIFKSNDPEKLVVFHAASLQNEIRFYLNDTQYLTAVECEEGFSIRLEKEREEEIEEEREEEGDKKGKISIIKENLREFIKLFSIIKENLREFIKLFSIIIGISILGFIGVLYLRKIIDSILVYLIIMNIVYFIINIVNVVIMETIEITHAIKSKHSAEHMMVNFLEINKRLPKNIEEVKKYSRFSPECGSQELIKGIAEELIRSIVASIFAVIVSIIVSHFYSNSVTYVIVFLSTYFLTKFVVGKAITKYCALNFIIKPIKKVLTNIVQCANTTSKVKDRDIILAYSVAKSWLQVVYPEFYNENEDIFWKQYLKIPSNLNYNHF